MAAANINDGINDIINEFNEIRINDQFERFTYNFGINKQNRTVSSTVQSLGLKHALNITNLTVMVNQEKGFYVDQNEEGIRYAAQVPVGFNWNLGLQRSEYEKREIPYNPNLVFSFSTWIREIENLTPNAFYFGFTTLRNLIMLPFEDDSQNINHNCKLYINLIDGKYRINGLSKEQRTPMSEDNKRFCYWGTKLASYATTDHLNELPVDPETTLPPKTNVFSLLCNTINNQTFYYLSGINCFADEDTNLASNCLELRALVLNCAILEKLRRIKNWKTSNKLSSFLASDRYKILEIIYKRKALESDWIKLFLLGTENYHVYLVDKTTGQTSEVLLIRKADMENYLEATSRYMNNHTFTPRRAIEKLESVLTWIQSLRLENNRYYTANYDAQRRQFTCIEDEEQNNAHHE